MKNINTKIYFVLSIVILASCSSNNEFSKRRYLDGFNGKETEMVHSTKNENNFKKDRKPSENLSSVVYSNQELTASTQESTPLILAETSTKVAPVVNVDKSFIQQSKPSLKEKIAVSKTVIKLNKLNNSPAQVNQGNIIEVVLAFLIPPLAVFLHNGLDTSFWISLILTCLLWVPGVIFSLLVVLDLI